MDTINIENISLTERGIRVLETLQADNGTAEFYDRHLSRLFRMILHSYDILGMDALEALDTLGTIDALRHDLALLAGGAGSGGVDDIPGDDDPAEDPPAAEE